MEKQTPRQNNSDEIDLAQFFRWIGRGFANTGRSMIYGLAVLRQQFFSNRVFFLGIIVLGLILGVFYSEWLRKDYYKSSMVLSCDYLSTQILNNTVQKLNLLASEKGNDGIQRLLNVDETTAANIQKFEFKPFVSEEAVVEMEVLREQLNNVTDDKKELVEKIIDRLKIQNENTFEINVYVYDPDIVKPLEKALVDFFNSNSYIKRRIEINKISLQNRKAKLEKELRKLDSLKNVILQNYQSLEKNRGSNNVVVAGEETNPIDIFTKDLELHDELQEVNEQLYLSPDFELVDGFTSFKEPEGAGLTKILVVALFLSILVGYLILGVYKFDRMLAKYPTH
jgi:hypothetical protein